MSMKRGTDLGFAAGADGYRIATGYIPRSLLLLYLAIHLAPKREAFVCLDALSRFIRDRRIRQLAADCQTKGDDIHSLEYR